jgi:hypothetical protein
MKAARLTSRKIRRTAEHAARSAPKVTLPAAERLHKKHADVAVIGIDLDDSQTVASEMVTTYGLTFAVVHDAGNVLSGRFRVHDLPVTFVADRTGNVVRVLGPGQTEAELEAVLHDL